MTERYVIDTTSIICYFHDVFQQRDRLSDKARKLLGQAFSTDSGSVKLSIPSIVFVEIYDKWITDEEFARKFFYEVYTPIGQSPNIEVKPIEREVLEAVQGIGGNLAHHEIHDKLIVASAITLNCPIITTDSEIIKYAKRNNAAIPSYVD